MIENTLQVARAEIRSAYRLLRLRVAAVLLTILSVAAYVISCIVQSFVAPYSPSFVGATPLYLLGNIDPTYFLIFQVAALFLLFDVDHRHSRNRISEVLESRPLSNAEYLAGRILGYTGLVWVVVAANVLAMHSFGLIAQWSRFEFGGSLQLHSIFNLLLLDAPVTLLLWCSFVVFLSSVFRNRLITFALALASMCGWSLLVQITPFALLDLVSPSSNDTLIVSDVLPELPSMTSLTLRLGTIALAALFTTLAVWLYRRRDAPTHAPKFFVAAGLSAVVLGTFSAAGINVLQQKSEFATWRMAHQTYEIDGHVDVQRIQGDVRIEPRKQLEIDLHLHFNVSSEHPANDLVFTLNPGMKISGIELNGTTQEFSFANGILEVIHKQSLESDNTHILRVVAGGIPDPRFSFLDAHYDYTLDPNSSLEVTRSLGTDASIFDRRYVALMPGSYWYPVPGLVNDRFGDVNREKDYFDLDLSVELTNAAWLLAGTGVHRTSDSMSDGYAVKPDAPVAECGLFASNFVTATTEIDGVTFSVLLHAQHARNLSMPEQLVEELHLATSQVLQKLSQVELHPTQNSLSVVEVPNRLRTVGGGWRMDSQNAVPGAILLKERGFPVARIDLALKRQLDPQLKFIRFSSFFQNGLGTDNPFNTIHRHYWSHATSASGHQSELLDHFIDSLLSNYMQDEIHDLWFAFSDIRWFSIYAAIPFLRMATVHPLYLFEVDSAGQSIYRSRIQQQEQAYARRSSILDSIEKNSLADLPSDLGHKRDLELAMLKVEKVADAFSRYEQDTDKILAWLATLRKRFYGRTFQYNDLIASLREHDIEVHPFLTEWFTASTIPGFIASRATIVRLSDDKDGNTRYQTKFAIRNTRPVDGFVNVNHQNETVSVRIDGESAREISFVSENPPVLDNTKRFRVYTGLSLNRGDLHIPLDVTNIPWHRDEVPSSLEIESDWEPEQVGIVIDDQDAGFSVEQPRTFLQHSRLIGPARWFLWPLPEVEHDAQLPNLGEWYVLPQGWWRRTNEQNAYGLYRGTLAMTYVGNSRKTKLARFATEIPHAGQWTLDFHVHDGSLWFGYPELANFQLQVSSGADTWNAKVDPVTSAPEWRYVGNFDLLTGNVNVDVIGATNRSIVYADAIRWTQSDVEKQ